MAQALPHAIMYTAGQHHQMQYLPQYYTTPYAQYAPSPYPDRTLKTTERRRPKYTRSKLGCLTCRKKKVKCDEIKPSCQRCTNSQLCCTWPEVPPPRKKAPSRKGRSPTDQDYSASTSEAGTSQSPTDAPDIDGTPQPQFKSEAPSPELKQVEGSPAPAMMFADPNLLHVGAGLSADRRHSEPHFTPLAPSAIEARRHSMADIMDGQHYGHHAAHQHDHHGMRPNSGALGLSLNQLAHTGTGTSTRPSTPNDFLYTHAPSQPTSAYPAYSHTGNMAIIPNISSGSTSNRPSAAASSLSLSHSYHHRTNANSRPSTAGAIGGGAGASITGHHYMHRPSSSGDVSGVGAGDYASLGLSPFSFQLGRTSRDVSLDQAGSLSGYVSASVSRPSTANSAASASPYMRHGAMPTDGCGAGSSAERWQPSPLLGQSSLAHPQPHVVDGSGVGGYFHQMMPSPPQHSRTHSPAWAC